MDLMLKDKVAIITGSTGICKTTALTLASEGADIAVTCLTDTDRDAAQDSIEKIEKMGRKAIALPLNLLKLNEIEKMVDDVLKEYGKIDILVNCAGVCAAVLGEDVTEDQWDLDMGVDLKGLFFCCKEVFNKSMKKQKSGSIINISSALGVSPIKTNPIYSTAKAGVIQISRYLAIEWGPYNVRVNTISPGWVATKLLVDGINKGTSKDPSPILPLGRLGKSEEIADVITFLASGKSSFMTGSNIVVDGGILAGLRIPSVKNGKLEVL